MEPEQKRTADPEQKRTADPEQKRTADPEQKRTADPEPSTEGDLLAVLRDSAAEWEEIALDGPPASLEWADQRVRLAERVSTLFQGRTVSMRGGALFQGGDYEEAEKCFYQAAALLSDHPADAADNLRRMAALRMAQKSFGEADGLIRRALQLSREHGSSEQVGKCIVEQGILHLDSGRYQSAAYSFSEALEHLDHQRPTHLIANINLLYSLVMIGGLEGIADLVNALSRLRKLAPRFSSARIRLDWLLAVGSIRLGSANYAAKNLPKIIKRLQKEGALEDIGYAKMDLAQAYFYQCDREKAIASLEDALDVFGKLSGFSAAAIEDLEQVISGLRSETESNVEPWDARRRIVRTSRQA